MQKNILTRDYVERELQFYNKADIRSTLVLSAVMALFFIPFAILGIVLVMAVVDELILKIVLCTLLGTLLSCPCWLHVLALIKHFQEGKQLKNSEFEIVTRKVRDKSEKVVHRHTEKFLSFEDFRDISVGGTTYDLSTYGDVFYIVHYRGKNEIKLLYPEKMYDFKENK